MKLIFLASSEANQSLLTSSLYGLGLHDVHCVTSWDALMQALVNDRPKLVILEYFAIAGDGTQALASADWALRAMKIPAVIALPPDTTSARTQLEMSTEFEHFVVAPFAPMELAEVIGDAVGDRTWQGRASEVSTFDLPTFGAEPEPPSVRQGPTHATVSVTVVPTEREEFGGESTAPRRGFSQFADEDAFFAAWDESVGPDGDNDPLAQTDVFQENSGFDRAVLLNSAVSAADSAAGGFDALAADDFEVGSFEVLADDDPAGLPQEQWGIPGNEPGISQGGLRNEGSAEAAVSTPESAQVESVAPEPQASENAPLEVDFVLPQIEAGELGDTNVAGVLHALSALGATGRLRLSQATLRREVLIANGTPGREDASTTAVESSRLVATFAWTEGTWVFIPERVMPIGFTPFCHALEFIYRGIETQLSMNDLARLLGPHFRSYPIRSNRLDRIASVRGLDAVAMLLQKFDGQVTFERAMVGLGVSAEDVLRVTYFGWICGLLVFSPQPSHPPAQVRYVPTVHGASPRLTVSDSPRRTTGVNAVVGVANRAQTTRVTASTAIVEEDRVEKETTSRLQGVLEAMANGDAYSVLSLAPGCGIDRINERYYELVRDYHPDRFSKNPQALSRGLAERIFMSVRNATAEARRLESGEITGASLSSARVRTGSVPAVGVPTGEAGKSRVADVLERLRSHSGSQAAVGGASTTGSFARVPTGVNVSTAGGFGSRPSSLTRTQVSQFSPEQMVRNARKLVEASAYEKAAEMLALARTRGVAGPALDALEEYIGFATERRTSRIALKRLNELLETEQNDIEKARIQVLLGHVLRVAGEDADALNAYAAASKLDSTNDESQRWVRHMKMKQTKKPQSESLLDKLRNTKITFPGSKAK